MNKIGLQQTPWPSCKKIEGALYKTDVHQEWILVVDIK